MLIAALLMSSALAVPVQDRLTGDPDSVVATAPATAVALDATTAPDAPPVRAVTPSGAPHGLDTDQQIAAWLNARAPAPSAAHDDPPVWRDDRKPHSEVSVGFGTGGYRDYAAAVSLPIGENGRLDISIRQTENAYPYGYGYGRGIYDPYFNDSGYVFPGSRPDAALDHERRLARPGGPPRQFPLSVPDRPTPD